MEPIAHIRTDLSQKFGIPRNSFLAPHLQGRIVFEPAYALPAAVQGLEGFSHLWLLWEFENGAPGGTAGDIAADSAACNLASSTTTGTASQAEEDCAEESTGTSCRCDTTGTGPAANPKPEQGAGARSGATQDTPDSGARWSPTVRPPRLGGSQRMGVFATRSPFRPNPIGLSCVQLERIELTDEGPVLHVLGADLRDGTPIYDIKPYIPFADCHPDAVAGFVEEVPWQELEVELPAALAAQLPPAKLPGLVEVLRQDPRRAGSKHEPQRIYHLAYAGFDVSFTVDSPTLHVTAITPV